MNRRRFLTWCAAVPLLGRLIPKPKPHKFEILTFRGRPIHSVSSLDAGPEEYCFAELVHYQHLPDEQYEEVKQALRKKYGL